MKRLRIRILVPAAAAGLAVTSGLALAAPAAPAPTLTPSAVATAPVAAETARSVDLATPLVEPVSHWSLADARALLAAIKVIGAEGLIPADYRPEDIEAALAAGEGEALDEVASRSFGWLVEDLRDGRTPMRARVQWFAVDNDDVASPAGTVLARALASHDIAGTLAALAPSYPDYAALRDALAATSEEDAETRALIRANMDRWRWLSRDMGAFFLIENVPEFTLRLVRNDKIIRSYRTIVGKPGRTATPQFSEMVEGVIFNPTWTVPQSIVVGEGLGTKVLRNPAWAKSQGYVATRSADGRLHVVQQPGPANALGLVKLDMPNPHTIFLHDTPSRQLFERDVRAFSHGCIRVDRARELGIALTIIGGSMSADEAAAVSDSGKYTRVPMARQMPIYVTYFTMGTGVDGEMARFNDLYGRDAPVLASFKAPRQLKTGQRYSEEKIEALKDAEL